jgi:hypothetical protein
MPNKADLNRLLEAMQNDREAFFSSGRNNNIFDITLSVLTVMASVAAACLIGASIGNRWLIALVAAIPAATTSIQTKVAIRERADWYFLYAAEVRALATELEFADPADVQSYAKRRASLEISMEEKWPRVGRHLAAQSKAARTGKVKDDD